MRGVKIALGGIVIILLAILVVENPGVFWDKKSLQLDLWMWRDQTPGIALAIYFLTFFIVGFLGAYFLSLAERFRTKRTVTLQQQTIYRLEQEIQSLKTPPTPSENTAVEKSEEPE